MFIIVEFIIISTMIFVYGLFINFFPNFRISLPLDDIEFHMFPFARASMQIYLQFEEFSLIEHGFC